MSTRMRSLGLAATFAMVLSAASLAFACTYTTGSISVRPESGVAGSRATVDGSGFLWKGGDGSAFSPVEIRWNSIAGPLLAKPRGRSFSVQVTIPQVEPGTYVIYATQYGGQSPPAGGARATFVVVASEGGSSVPDGGSTGEGGSTRGHTSGVSSGGSSPGQTSVAADGGDDEAEQVTSGEPGDGTGREPARAGSTTLSGGPGRASSQRISERAAPAREIGRERAVRSSSGGDPGRSLPLDQGGVDEDGRGPVAVSKNDSSNTAVEVVAPRERISDLNPAGSGPGSSQIPSGAGVPSEASVSDDLFSGLGSSRAYAAIPALTNLGPATTRSRDLAVGLGILGSGLLALVAALAVGVKARRRQAYVNR